MNTLLRKTLTLIPVVGEILLVVVLADELATRIKNRRLTQTVTNNRTYLA